MNAGEFKKQQIENRVKQTRVIQEWLNTQKEYLKDQLEKDLIRQSTCTSRTFFVLDLSRYQYREEVRFLIFKRPVYESVGNLKSEWCGVIREYLESILEDKGFKIDYKNSGISKSIWKVD